MNTDYWFGRVKSPYFVPSSLLRILSLREVIVSPPRVEGFWKSDTIKSVLTKANWQKKKKIKGILQAYILYLDAHKIFTMIPENSHYYSFEEWILTYTLSQNGKLGLSVYGWIDVSSL